MTLQPSVEQKMAQRGKPQQQQQHTHTLVTIHELVGGEIFPLRNGFTSCLISLLILSENIYTKYVDYSLD